MEKETTEFGEWNPCPECDRPYTFHHYNRVLNALICPALNPVFKKE